jgi:hypothetical protein
VIRIQALGLRLPALSGFIAAWPFEAQRQTLFTVETVYPFAIIAPALTPEHHVYPAISVVNSRFGDLTDTQAQCAVIGSN